MPERRAIRCGAAWAAALLLLALAGLGGRRLLCDPPALRADAPAAPPVALAPARLSLLALGDTGHYHAPWAFGDGQRSVARGLVQEDRRAPVDALLLLGDNFYPSGLLRAELVPRIRENLVRPYCRFAQLGGVRSPEVAGACRLPEAQRHPIPLYAVLGNHDHESPESPALEREEIPRFLPNWSLPASIAETRELGAGVSLIRVDSEPLQDGGSLAPVREALRRARGPWRILALHHPIAAREGEPLDGDGFGARMQRAVSAAGVPVQLVLSGHRHNLQVAALSLERPALQVISGGGSSRRKLRDPPLANRLFAIATLGFVRVDLVGEGRDEGLVISIYTMPRSPIVFWRSPRLVSRWWLERSGRAFRAFPRPG